MNAAKTLYKAHSNSVGYWSIGVSVEGLQAMLNIEHCKTMDGKAVVQKVPVEGKNIGRANETTPEQQAHKEMQSRIKKQLDKGYQEEKPELGAKATNSLGLEKPMLATPIEKVKPEIIDWDNAFIQPKLDGHRAMWKNGVLYSRQGKEINLPHITRFLSRLPEGVHLDGELYCHGLTLQQIGSLVKKPREESQQIVFHVYDCVSAKPFAERYCDAEALLGQLLGNRPIVTVETSRVPSPEVVTKLHADYVSDGYEGAILRHGTKGYEDDKRSRNLLKIKGYQDDEFEIIGCVEGTKRYLEAEDRWLHCAVFVMKTKDGKEFEATAPGTMYEKHDAWINRESYIGKVMTVKYFNYSKDGVPQQPVAMQLREDI